MRSLASIARCLALACFALLATACEGPNWGKDTSGSITSLADWTDIDSSQLTAHLAEVLSGLPLRDAKRRLINNTQQQDMVTITDRGWATTYRMISSNRYFSDRDFFLLGSRDAFESWVKERFPRARAIEFLDVIPVTHPHHATRGFAATILVTNEQDRKFRCAIANSGYGGPRFSETSTDIPRPADMNSTLRIMLCTTNASAASLHQRMQRVAF
jgi:hypothetical protein